MLIIGYHVHVATLYLLHMFLYQKVQFPDLSTGKMKALTAHIHESYEAGAERGLMGLPQLIDRSHDQLFGSNTA